MRKLSIDYIHTAAIVELKRGLSDKALVLRAPTPALSILLKRTIRVSYVPCHPSLTLKKEGKKMIVLWKESIDQTGLLHLKSIHPLWKILERGGVKFLMHLLSLWFLDSVYHRGSKYFTKKFQISLATWTSHSPVGGVSWIFHMECVDSKLVVGPKLTNPECC